MLTNFISSEDSNDETHIMHTKSNNIEIMISTETDEITEELLKSLLQRYQEGTKKSQKGSEFVYNSVNLLHYWLQKTSLKRTVSSYLDSPKWLKKKKAIINPKNNDDKCFQYALTVVLNHKQIKNHPDRISNLKLFISQYKWKVINFPAQPSKNWKKFELNNKSIALNVLYVPHNTEKIRLAYKSKHNFKR